LKPDTWIGQKVEMLVPESYRRQHHHHRQTFVETPKPFTRTDLLNTINATLA
jgi:hypothetical protein